MTLTNGAKQLMPFIGAKSPCLEALLNTARASVPIAPATRYTKSLLDNRHTAMNYQNQQLIQRPVKQRHTVAT